MQVLLCPPRRDIYEGQKMKKRKLFIITVLALQAMLSSFALAGVGYISQYYSYNSQNINSSSIVEASSDKKTVVTEASTFAILSITPNSGYSTGTINIDSIMGADLSDISQVVLTKEGESDIVATNILIPSSYQINCKFDLVEKKKDKWDVKVIKNNGTSAVLSQGFTIKEYSQADGVVNYPNPFNPASGPTNIVYTLTEATDVAVLVFNISNELIWRGNYVMNMQGGMSGDNKIQWDGYSSFGDMSGNGVYFCKVINKRTGKMITKGKIAVLK